LLYGLYSFLPVLRLVNVAVYVFLSTAVRFNPYSIFTPLLVNSSLINESAESKYYTNLSLAFTTVNELIGDNFPCDLYQLHIYYEIKKL